MVTQSRFDPGEPDEQSSRQEDIADDPRPAVTEREAVARLSPKGKPFGPAGERVPRADEHQALPANRMRTMSRPTRWSSQDGRDVPGRVLIAEQAAATMSTKQAQPGPATQSGTGASARPPVSIESEQIEAVAAGGGSGSFCPEAPQRCFAQQNPAPFSAGPAHEVKDAEAHSMVKPIEM